MCIRDRVLSDEDTAELKKLYRETVKKLHPDLNPNVTEAELELFERAAEAYSRGDLNSLRMIDSLLESKEEHDYGSDAMDRLVKAKRRLTQSIGETKRAIKKIKCEYPYILKTILDDKEELAAKREGLEQRIEWANDLAAGLRQKIKEMLA